MKKTNIFILAAVAVLTGCATNEVQEPSAAPSALSQVELHQVLINHTFPYSKGGIFFASESEATIHWDGKNEDVTWYATDDSKFCYTAELFGGEEECLTLRRTASGNYLRGYEGKIKQVKASEIIKGQAF